VRRARVGAMSKKSQSSGAGNARQQAEENERWTEREEKMRERQWQMFERLLAVAGTLLERVLFRRKREATLAEVSRMLELAAQLGRLATDPGNSRDGVSAGWSPAFEAEWERSLLKVYGPEWVAGRKAREGRQGPGGRSQETGNSPAFTRAAARKGVEAV